MGTFIQDLRYGFRSVTKRPAFTLIAVLTLALGIGANSTVFTFLNAVLFEAIPFKDTQRTIFVYSANSQTHSSRELSSVPDFIAWRTRSKSFDQLAAAGSDTLTVTGDGRPERVQATFVTANFFQLLDSSTFIGRTFDQSEEHSANARSIVLSHGFWQRRFGGEANVIGQTLTLDAKTYTIIGVMPRNFWFPRPEVAVWMPLAADAAWPASSRFLMVFGKLKQDVGVQQARVEMDALSKQLAEQNPNSDSGWTANVLTLNQALLKDSDRAVARLLVATVLFVLLIACANISNLLLSRAVGRQKEIAVRIALGATRARVIRQLLTESLILALAGGLAGLMIAFWGADALIAVVPHRAPPPETLVNGFVFGITMLLALASAVVFGLAPAFEISKADVNSTLKDTNRSGSPSVQGRRFRQLLVVGEITLTLMLLIGGGLVIRQTIHFLNIDPGYNTKGLLSLDIELPVDRYASPAAIDAFYSDALTRTGSLPGVSSSAATSAVPVASDGAATRYVLSGNEAAPVEERPAGTSTVVSAAFFHTLGIPILKGRSFEIGDDTRSQPVAIVNETLVKRSFANRDPIGQAIALSNDQGLSQWLTIIGVTKDLMPENLNVGKQPQVYVPASQYPNRSMSLVLRTSGDPLSLTASAREAISSIDPNLPIDKASTVEALIRDDFKGVIELSYVFAVFGGLALLLATIGVYGVAAYSAAQRTQEIGIRLALGASRRAVLTLVFGQGLGIILMGTVLGLAGALALSRVLSRTLVGISASDPVTYFVSAIVLIGVALIATYLPARRAMRIDPMTALRRE